MNIIPKQDRRSDPDLGTYWVLHIADLFLDGWLVMLTFGVLHDSAKSVPAFGYWQSLMVGWVVGGLVMSGTALTRRRVAALAGYKT